MGEGPYGYNNFCRLDLNRRPICDCIPRFSPLDPNNKKNGYKDEKAQYCKLGKLKLEDIYTMQDLANTYWPTSSNVE